ncbi:MAG TPA: hypothetical protein VN408_30410 [Actinoplanes sp.]|nr:hypothetical protein [Actinoplanes sp.]
MPVYVGGALTRADIEAWDTTHLETAATHWRSTAAHWEGHFETIHTGMLRPGGTTWEGTAADAAAERSWGDLVKVRGAGDALYAAAGHATNGAGDIAWAKRQVLDAITEAEEAGFTVGQDFSVTDKSWGGLMRSTVARQQEAVAHAQAIQAAVTQLVAVDKVVAEQITAALAPLESLQFPEDGHNGDPTVQMTDYGFKKDTPTDPKDPNPNYPGRTADGKFAPGNSGVDGDQAAQDFFNRRQEITKLPIERQKIRISVTDPKTGTVYTRYYDGLEPVPGQPGKYTGLEHKYGSGRLTPQQAIVDDLVNEGADARGTLDGKPIQVVKALEFNTAAVAAPAPPAEAAGPAEAPRAPLAEAGPARAPPLVEAPEVPKLPLAEAAPDLLPHGYGGFGPTIPTPVPPPHSIGHLPVLGRDDPNAPWEYEEK